MFDYSWIDYVTRYGEHTTLIIAAGIFHYFHEDRVIDRHDLDLIDEGVYENF